MLEAQAAGCLPMVTPLGALRERVVHGKTGWVEAPDAFEARIVDHAAAAAEQSTMDMREAARAAAGKLTWDASARRFEEALERARRAAGTRWGRVVVLDDRARSRAGRTAPRSQRSSSRCDSRRRRTTGSGQRSRRSATCSTARCNGGRM